MNPDLLQTYQSLADQYQSKSTLKQKQLKTISFFRLICFVAIFPVFYYLYPHNTILGYTIASFLLIGFLFLIKRFIQEEKQLIYYQRLTKINQNEIHAFQRNFSNFDHGSEFTSVHHDYSYDLDIYGPGSFFQFLNRTITSRGKNHLAFLLNHSQRPSTEISDKQNAIQELASELNWRQEFMAKGIELEDKKVVDQTDESIRQKIELKSVTVLKYLLKILPAFTILMIGLSLFDLVSKSYYLIPVFSQWILFLVYSRTISKFQRQFEGQAKVLNRYSEMLKQLEDMPFSSNYLQQLKDKLSHNGKKASTITAELHKILNEFDFRLNIIVGIVLNSLFLWDIRCIFKMNTWQQNYSGDLQKWFFVIAEIDALISFANCNYNHTNWATPKISESGFQLKAEQMGHPLIAKNKCITNSFQLCNEEQIVIITGANMAGKSTFLRTIGINLILASNGCKVFASEFQFSPIRIFTNMRTSDNLMNDESYFYAELLRLQTMLNLLREGEELFVIVDEMLKGTNSVDKLNGSKELIKQLLALKTHGIVATHDLSLTELKTAYPEALKNQCFEVILNNDELSFDYKLTSGVTRTMNATFLMKKMGIIPGK